MAAEVLFVCTANVCRSPVAELLARAHPDWPSDLATSSAGTHAQPRGGVHPAMQGLLNEGGVHAVRFRSRPLTAGIADSAGLVLTMTREHRHHVVTMSPATVRRAFTLREFAYLLTFPAPDDAGRGATGLPAALSRALRLRGPATLALDGSELDIDDPVGLPPDAYRRAYLAIEQAVDVIATQLAGTVDLTARHHAADSGPLGA